VRKSHEIKDKYYLAALEAKPIKNYPKEVVLESAVIFI
jgi:hypothetical protein